MARYGTSTNVTHGASARAPQGVAATVSDHRSFASVAGANQRFGNSLFGKNSSLIRNDFRCQSARNNREVVFDMTELATDEFTFWILTGESVI
jgi:hypothetical protein